MAVISEKYQEWVRLVIARTSPSSLLPKTYWQPQSDAEYPQTVAAAVEATKMVREKALLQFDAELDSEITKLTAIGWNSIRLKIENSTILLEGKKPVSLTSFKTWPWMFDKPHHEFDQTVLGCHLSKMSDAHFKLSFRPQRYASYSIMEIACRQDKPLAFQPSGKCIGNFQRAAAMKITYQQVRALFQSLPVEKLPSTARDLIAECCADASQIAFLNVQRLTSLSEAGRTAQTCKFDKGLRGAIQEAALKGYSGIVGQALGEYRMEIKETGKELQSFESWMMTKEDNSVRFLEKYLTSKGFKEARCTSSSMLKLTWDVDM
mmetsp:Transcript_18592/g.30912  ORF Transcript_18592/g.30912 Transcript_18592/m.30912 type:complete len:320 (+) Transcript_18592:157-1116(+)